MRSKSRKKVNIVKTAVEPAVAEQDDEHTSLTFSRVIDMVGSNQSFSGWGPKVAAPSAIIRILN